MDSGWEMGQEMTGTAFGGCMGFGGCGTAIEGRAPVSCGMTETWPGKVYLPPEQTFYDDPTSRDRKHGLGRVYLHSITDLLR